MCAQLAGKFISNNTKIEEPEGKLLCQIASSFINVYLGKVYAVYLSDFGGHILCRSLLNSILVLISFLRCNQVGCWFLIQPEKPNPVEMNSKEVDFSTADLGLKLGIEEEENNDDFDAFNADTFGSEEVWHEDDHEEVENSIRF